MKRLAAAIAAVTLLAGCTSGAPTGSVTPPPVVSSPATTAGPDAPTPSPTPSASTTSPPSVAECAATVVDGLSLRERVGLTVMVGVTDASSSELSVLRSQRIGSVILMGQHTDGVAGVRRLTARLALDDLPTPLLISVDQEGGVVQRLKGTGFSTIPSAVVQAGWSDATLRSRAARWGRQLASAGVGWTLAPVADTVPADMTSRNEPIGVLKRGYGSTPGTVADKVTAFVQGMHDSGVATSAKHFPGIGRVVGNTDFTAGVKDTVTRSDDPYLQPFAAAVEAGAPSIMVSTVTYTRIDARHPAVFSPTVIGLLRDQLGFDGVVISDDLGAAKSMASVPADERGVGFIEAGGDIAMTVTPGLADDFAAGIRRAARDDPAVADQVRAAATRVVAMKIDAGLLPCR